jgi:hypothetical protein
MLGINTMIEWNNWPHDNGATLGIVGDIGDHL